MELSHLKTIYFGSSEFALPIFEALLNERIKILAVVTQPDRPTGRDLRLTPTPMKVAARSHKFDVLQFPSLSESDAVGALKVLDADLAIVASYGQIIPKPVLSSSRLGFVNVHPSLLPKYRGPSPIQTVILNGERTTGVTIMLLDDKMDHGPLLAQSEIAIKADDTYLSLHDRLASEGARLLVATLSLWLSEKIRPQAQDDKSATFTTLLTRETGRINWRASAEQINRHVRAFTPWPGSWSMLDEERYKIIEAAPAQSKPLPLPGQLLFLGNRLYVGCGSMTSLEIIKIQPAGRSVLTAEQFIRGYRGQSGKIFN
ncbi:MAG: methionyl-tRNA formyltransferase [Candidatus Doudnabacteria bacterium RIFCSPHIGHO2_01_FULL_50_11]|uniref:Methionyl-tRNA formyltransferase n=1 Tax=Candidatus Doudnabacteria bacterium RIFCSPHIGHO2_01_FULL_50_11 TaxID=1817828 RepID=A0A1F5PKX4_9BACT|nr:MAG: methionyl-tRNA formyltransferase [Candidatus Doudnabacteria bacterium RIFCSPHIGHO2_01_FULL_50_11]HLC44697.1 methionyl-tRNA formyltransferase [Patescibacteria group bacterium]